MAVEDLNTAARVAEAHPRLAEYSLTPTGRVDGDEVEVTGIAVGAGRRGGDLVFVGWLNPDEVPAKGPDATFTLYGASPTDRAMDRVRFGKLFFGEGGDRG